jgi:thiol-disulfide isomerase/thioredoxin
VREAEGVGEIFTLHFKDLISGREMSIEELRGKVVLINFWATWCGPCVGEVPELKKIYEKYHDRGVENIGISLDDDPAKLLEFCREKEMTWPQHCEPGKGWDTAIARKWGVNGIPRLIVLDKQGKVRSTQARIIDLESFIFRLQKE